MEEQVRLKELKNKRKWRANNWIEQQKETKSKEFKNMERDKATIDSRQDRYKKKWEDLKKIRRDNEKRRS